MSKVKLPITGNPDADQLLTDNPLALLLGMLLDQQVTMEKAFSGPAVLAERLGHLDAARIAAMDLDEFIAVCAQTPAIHRYPTSMGTRVWEACVFISERYDNDASKLWKRVRDGATLLTRVREVPGFGDEKSRIFVALLAKRFGRRPQGWELASEPFGDDQPRSVADVYDEASLLAVREAKKAAKAKKKAAAAAKVTA
ncbi:MAG TPA: HhH-GPD-type base excision DNA repair protein [Microthrixaceae bacterium]|nr:HhH-GPD-type base excision DNA repair protein [Microthrixaceae bacterium]